MIKKKNKIIKPLLITLVFLGIFSYFFLYIPFNKIKIKATEVMAEATKMKEALKSNNIDEVKQILVLTQGKYQAFSKEASSVYWMSYIPFLGNYVSDLKNGVVAGDNMIKAGLTSVDAVSPYADLIGFKKGSASFIERSADERLHTAVLTLDKMLVKVDDIAIYVDNARKALDNIDEKRYPTKIGKTEVQGKIKDLKDQFNGMASLFVDAKPLLKNIPSILGADKEKTYLFLFQNDKELRPTGGFLTAYAVFKVKDGKFKVEKSTDIYNLDNSINPKTPAPKEILTYHKGVYEFNIRDSNLSPDVVKSLELFNSLYKNSSERVNYDGVFFIDTNVLVDTLSILGDTEVNGTVFSARKDKRCYNVCSQVVYELLDQVDRPVNYIKTDRKGILGDLLYTIMQKALGFSPSKYWGKLFSEVMIKNLNEKHIVMFLKDSDSQKSLEKIDFAGRINDYSGDYLSIVDTNFAGAKSNMFVTQKVKVETNIKGDGTVEKTVTIDYQNKYPHSDCNLERGGLCMNATLRDWLRIYVPKGAKLTSFQGSEKATKTYDDLGKTVFEGFLNINPEGSSKVVVKYELAQKIKENEYKILIQKQAGTYNNAYEVLLNGSTLKKFELLKDIEIKK